MKQCGAPVIKRLRALFIVSPSLRHWMSLFLSLSHDGRWKIIKSFGYFLFILLNIDNKIHIIFQNANDECEGGKTSELTTIITLNFTVRFFYSNTLPFILCTFNPETGSLWWKWNGIYRKKIQKEFVRRENWSINLWNLIKSYVIWSIYCPKKWCLSRFIPKNSSWNKIVQHKKSFVRWFLCVFFLNNRSVEWWSDASNWLQRWFFCFAVCVALVIICSCLTNKVISFKFRIPKKS